MKKRFHPLLAALAALLSAPAVQAADNALFTKEILVPAESLSQLTPPPADPRALESRLDRQVLGASNRQRAGAGLAALTLDPALSAAAARYSRLMRDQGFFDHVSPVGEGLDNRLPRADRWRYEQLGENLWTAQGAIDWRADRIAGEAAANWIESPSHRENLLDPAYTVAGVGTAIRGDEIWITMLYGRPHADLAQAALLRDHGEAPADLDGLARSMTADALSAINRDRAAAGVRTLGGDAALSDVARAHARRMLASGTLTTQGALETALAGGGIRELALAVWQGSGGLVWRPDTMTGAMMNTWRQSASSRADLVNPRFDRAGIGVATDGTAVFVAAFFARTGG